MTNRADDHATFMTAMGEPVGLSVSDAPLPPLAAPLPRARIDAAAKRALDIAASALMLLALLPLILIVALLVRLDSPGPAFFQVDRIGRGGRRAADAQVPQDARRRDQASRSRCTRTIA